jgi:hypothetical protein
MSIVLVHNAFSNWPGFERELREKLSEQLDRESVERVMARTLHAFNAMQLRRLAGSLEEELALDARRHEIFNSDFRSAKRKVLSLLIDSFVTIEKSK